MKLWRRPSAAGRPGKPPPWHRRMGHALSHSLRKRLMVLFLLLALGVALVFVGGVKAVVVNGWRATALPLLSDYADRLAAEIGSPPDVEHAKAIAARLPVSIRIEGPTVHWNSHPELGSHRWERVDDDMPRMLRRTTADGHVIEFGLSAAMWERRPRMVWVTLGSLLLLTALAYAYLRRLLKPLDHIQAGAQRFGRGDFSEPIPVRCPQRPDELGQLAQTINTMGEDIHQMLEAKRALLLAISHELRSPLTRARLNIELLPDGPDVAPQRDALLRDMGEMARLITDLLESERLATRHAALQREPCDLRALADEVRCELRERHARTDGRGEVVVQADANLPALLLDRARMRLLLRNLLDNSLRHGAAAGRPTELLLRRTAEGGASIEVRDHGPGVPDDRLPHLAEPFYRPDAARQRATGGVGLGLYLCRLVVQAHGGQFAVRNAEPGLAIRVVLPPAAE